MRMTISGFGLVCLLVVLLLSHAVQPLHVDDDERVIGGMEERDAYMWELYKNSPTYDHEIHNALTKIAYLDSRIQMLGLILFGPRKQRSILRAVRVHESLPLVDDQQYLKSTIKLFEKHCGAITEHWMKQSLANICNYVADKAAIQEAILLACASQATESHGIDMTNPKLDLRPAPIHGTSHYCDRVAVNTTSRMKLDPYAKSYKVMLVMSHRIPDSYENMIQVCFHRNDSLGLCQCEKDEWKPIRKRSWSSSMQPYEQRFIDVKFTVQLSGSVTITLEEGLSEGWQYVLLLGGIALLFMAVRKALMFLKKIYQQNRLEQGSVSESVSAREFKVWVIRNAHRIKLLPKAD